jgi:hypothetical protein
MAETLVKAQGFGVTVLVGPYTSDQHTPDQRNAAVVEFPGGYIAEIHAASKR